MKGLGRAAVGTALLLPLAVAPLSGQTPWRFDIGVNGGGSWYSGLLGGDHTGGDAVKFQPNWLTGGQVGVWFTPRIGIRANMTYTDTKLKQGDTELYGDVNLWSGSGDVLIRLTNPPANFTGFKALPYVALGAGAKWINPAGDFFFANAGGDATSGVPFTCVGGTCFGPGGVPGTTATNFFLKEKSSFMGLGGVGADLRVAPNFAIRLEAGDRIYKPSVIATGATGFPGVVTAVSTDNVGKLVNEIYGQAGLHLLLGVAAPAVVAITPAPAPPAPPPPPPAPTTETVNVCVVDVTQPTGLRMLEATRTIATNDTTVMVNGQSVPLAQAVGTVPVTSTATWYIQGQPLVIGKRHQLKFVSFGSPRTATVDEFAFLGTVDGLPVYADKGTVADVQANLDQARTANNNDLTAIVDAQTNIRSALDKPNVVLYTPLQPTGCVFQPVQLQQQVRKVRG